MRIIIRHLEEIDNIAEERKPLANDFKEIQK